MAVCQVDTGGLSVRGMVESYCESEASIGVSAPRKSPRVFSRKKKAYIPHETATGAELNSVRWVSSANITMNPHYIRRDEQ